MIVRARSCGGPGRRRRSQPRRHEHDQRGRDEQPGGVPGVDHPSGSLLACAASLGRPMCPTCTESPVSLRTVCCALCTKELGPADVRWGGSALELGRDGPSPGWRRRHRRRGRSGADAPRAVPGGHEDALQAVHRPDERPPVDRLWAGADAASHDRRIRPAPARSAPRGPRAAGPGPRDRAPRQEGRADRADAAGGDHREGEEAIGGLVVADRAVDRVHGPLLENARRGRGERNLNGDAIGRPDRPPGAVGSRSPRSTDPWRPGSRRPPARSRPPAAARDQPQSLRRARQAAARLRNARREPPWPGWRRVAGWGSRSPAARRTGRRPASARAHAGLARPGRWQPGRVRGVQLRMRAWPAAVFGQQQEAGLAPREGEPAIGQRAVVLQRGLVQRREDPVEGCWTTPELRPDAPAPISVASTRTTDAPRSAAKAAAEQPMIPPPTMDRSGCAMARQRSRAATIEPVKVVSGLGNPGERHRLTRHNVGFRVVDLLADRWGLTGEGRVRDGAARLEVQLSDPEERVLLVKPMKFMNLSGGPLRAALRQTGADPARTCWWSTDDADLPLGRLRLRREGSAGGHNGLRDIIASLGTNEFNRLRVGIGRPGSSRVTSTTCWPPSSRARGAGHRGDRRRGRCRETWLRDGIDDGHERVQRPGPGRPVA